MAERRIVPVAAVLDCVVRRLISTCSTCFDPPRRGATERFRDGYRNPFPLRRPFMKSTHRESAQRPQGASLRGTPSTRFSNNEKVLHDLRQPVRMPLDHSTTEAPRLPQAPSRRSGVAFIVVRGSSFMGDIGHEILSPFSSSLIREISRRQHARRFLLLRASLREGRDADDADLEGLVPELGA